MALSKVIGREKKNFSLKALLFNLIRKNKQTNNLVYKLKEKRIKQFIINLFKALN